MRSEPSQHLHFSQVMLCVENRGHTKWAADLQNCELKDKFCISHLRVQSFVMQ